MSRLSVTLRDWWKVKSAQRISPAFTPALVVPTASILMATESGQLSELLGMLLACAIIPGIAVSNSAGARTAQLPARIAFWFASIGTIGLLAIGRIDRLEALLGACAAGILSASFRLTSRRVFAQLWAWSAGLVMASAWGPGGMLLVALAIIWTIASLVLFARLARDYRPRRTSGDTACVLTTRDSINVEEKLGARWVTLGLAGAALSCMLFLLVPRPAQLSDRWRADLAAAEERAHALAAGFADEVDLSRVSSLKGSDSVVLRLRVERPSLRLSDFKLRLNVLDTFDGWRWSRSEPSSGPQSVEMKPAREGISRVDFIETFGGSPQALRESLVLEVAEPFKGAIPVPVGTVALEAPVRSIMVEEDGLLQLPPSAPPVYHFRYEVANDFGRRPLARRGGVEGRHLTLLADDAVTETLAEIARRAIASAPDHSEPGSALEAWFRRNGQYTTDFLGTEGGSSLDAFLARGLTGHCELFATAMALAARTQGLASRVVVGFSGGEYEPSEHAIVVRARDAHAWVEVNTPDRGWVAYDPTPAAPFSATTSLADATTGLGILGWIEHAVGGVRSAFVDYNGERQTAILRDAMRGLEARLNDFDNGLMVRTVERLRDGSRSPGFWPTVLLLVLVNLAAWVAERAWRTRRVRRSLATDRSPTIGTAPAVLVQALAALGSGVGSAGGTSGARLLREAALERGWAVGEAESLGELYARWRFGGDDSCAQALLGVISGRIAAEGSGPGSRQRVS